MQISERKSLLQQKFDEFCRKFSLKFGKCLMTPESIIANKLLVLSWLNDVSSVRPAYGTFRCPVLVTGFHTEAANSSSKVDEGSSNRNFRFAADHHASYSFLDQPWIQICSQNRKLRVIFLLNCKSGTALDWRRPFVMSKFQDCSQKNKAIVKRCHVQLRICRKLFSVDLPELNIDNTRQTM